MSKKGFTLVEIMIVVGIIAILAGIFLVGSAQFRRSANISRMKADLQKIEAYQELYANKKGGYASSLEDLVRELNIQEPELPSGVSGSYDTNGGNSCVTGLDADYTAAWGTASKCLPESGSR